MQSKNSEKKKKKVRHLDDPLAYLFPKFFVLTVFIMFILSAWFYIDWLYKPGNFPIKQVELTSKLNNQESKELQRVASKAVNGGFFSLDIDLFRTELLINLAWVKEATIRKIWPDRLLVTIKEHQPVGRWISFEKKDKNGSEEQDEIELLSRDGIIFHPKLSEQQRHRFNRLAVLTGPEISTKNVLNTCFKINENLKQLKIRVQRCGMNGRRSWIITLSNGIVIKLGKENIMQNLTQYINVFSGQLRKYFDQVEYADLRFSNGFSVKWKSETNNGNRQGI